MPIAKNTLDITPEIIEARKEYGSHLIEAINRAEEWDSVSPNEVMGFHQALGMVATRGNAIISASQALPYARRFIRKIHKNEKHTTEEIRTACGDIHFRLSTFLKLEGIENILTVGTIIYDGKAIWDVTLDSLQSELEGNMQDSDPLNLHAWVTFPDMSIMDATFWFFENRPRLPKNFKWEDKIICDEPSNKRRIYRPMVIGREFLRKAFRI